MTPGGGDAVAGSSYKSPLVVLHERYLNHSLADD